MSIPLLAMVIQVQASTVLGLRGAYMLFYNREVCSNQQRLCFRLTVGLMAAVTGGLAVWYTVSQNE